MLMHLQSQSQYSNLLAWSFQLKIKPPAQNVFGRCIIVYESEITILYHIPKKMFNSVKFWQLSWIGNWQTIHKFDRELKKEHPLCRQVRHVFKFQTNLKIQNVSFLRKLSLVAFLNQSLTNISWVVVVIFKWLLLRWGLSKEDL